MKTFFFLVLTLLGTGTAQAYPVIDRIAETGGEPIKVYPDNFRSGVYW